MNDISGIFYSIQDDIFIALFHLSMVSPKFYLEINHSLSSMLYKWGYLEGGTSK